MIVKKRIENWLGDIITLSIIKAAIKIQKANEEVAKNQSVQAAEIVKAGVLAALDEWVKKQKEIPPGVS